MNNEKHIVVDFADHKQATDIFDEAFEHPEIRYSVEPRDPGVAISWLRDNAYKRSFGWGDPGKHPPMHYGELIHLNEMYYRNRCGYAAEDYTCDHPDREDAEVDNEGKRLCFASTCPIASLACCEDFKELDPDLYKEYDCAERDDGDSVDQEWMILHSRPREAYVENVTVVGCYQDQGMWRRQAKETNPGGIVENP